MYVNMNGKLGFNLFVSCNAYVFVKKTNINNIVMRKQYIEKCTVSNDERTVAMSLLYRKDKVKWPK